MTYKTKVQNEKTYITLCSTCTFKFRTSFLFRYFRSKTTRLIQQIQLFGVT